MEDTVAEDVVRSGPSVVPFVLGLGDKVSILRRSLRSLYHPTCCNSPSHGRGGRWLGPRVTGVDSPVDEFDIDEIDETVVGPVS